MTTPHVHTQLAYYRDLAPEERRLVDAHLTACEECRVTLAAYTAQETRLKAMPQLRARRAWVPPHTAPLANALAHFGQALVFAGVAALLWLFALQLQQFNQGTPASPPITEPGLLIPPTSLQAPSPWLPALPWLGMALLMVGGSLALSRRSRWPAVIGASVAALLLITYIPPLSALPNPVAVYWRLLGGYSYDPRLPFKNAFLIAGRPEAQITPYLEALIGQTGLAPLDPSQPLRSYEIISVRLHPDRPRTALVNTRFVYADGSARIYPVPLASPTTDVFGFWLAGWQLDGLQRLRSEHLAFPEQPFATAQAPVQLGAPVHLNLAPAAQRLDELNPYHWFWNSSRLQHFVWSPQGESFLAVIELAHDQHQLWRVFLDATAPVLVTEDSVMEYGWSPAGDFIVYTHFDSAAAEVNPAQPYAIVAVAADGRNASALTERTRNAHTLVTGLPAPQLPGLTMEGAWFFAQDALWRAPFAGQPAQLIPHKLITDRFPAASFLFPPRPAPNGDWLAYVCDTGACLMRLDDSAPIFIPNIAPANMEWSADGTRLALVDRDLNNLRPVRLVVVDTAGHELFAENIAPFDVTEPPQWTPDGEVIFVQTYPQDGRRIIAAHLATHQVFDLSREHWDAYFALTPDGKHLLLNNGRGEFWLTPVVK